MCVCVTSQDISSSFFSFFTCFLIYCLLKRKILDRGTLLCSRGKNCKTFDFTFSYRSGTPNSSQSLGKCFPHIFQLICGNGTSVAWSHQKKICRFVPYRFHVELWGKCSRARSPSFMWVGAIPLSLKKASRWVHCLCLFFFFFLLALYFLLQLASLWHVLCKFTYN